MGNDATLLAVVDDDADVRVALTRLVSSAGFAVETFATARSSCIRSRTMSRTAWCSTCTCPEMSGFDVQGALAVGHAAVPVVVITGHDTPESRARALKLGAKAYLCKPVDDEALLAAIGSRHRSCRRLHIEAGAAMLLQVRLNPGATPCA